MSSSYKKPRVTIREWLLQHHSEYPNREDLIKACMRALRVRRANVRSKLRQEFPVDTSAPKKRAVGSTFTRDAFMAKFDEKTSMRLAIRAGLKKLTNDDIINDSDFRQMCGITSTTGWRQIAGEVEFMPHQFRCSGKIWWATYETRDWALKKIRKAKEL